MKVISRREDKKGMKGKGLEGEGVWKGKTRARDGELRRAVNFLSNEYVN
jgi:hypothetical protein